jgi:UPF0755 protein
MKRFLALALLIGLALTGYLAKQVFSPYGPDVRVFVDIPPGTSTRQIARMLTGAGVVRNEWAFLAARALNPGAKLQAGEYAFEGDATAADVYRKIARGDIFYFELTIPEGANIFDIGAAVEKLGVMKSAEFLKTASDPSIIRDLAPAAPSLEGYLFPSTYRITRKIKPAQLAQMMTRQFRSVWAEVAAKPGVDVQRATTLASLVEKETSIPSERPAVAAVYHNRLRTGMTLDCDPTTIYAALLENRYRGKIYRSDLDSTHAYNTYRNPGLPPGPIANPGRESLRAALQPADVDYLFFVAKPDGSGGHNFSRTLAQHNAAVAEYRRGLER